MPTEIPTTTALANWYGTDRMLCDRIAAELKGCNWVGVPFAGGMGALARIRCNYGVASDLHRHVINLARVVADPEGLTALLELLDGLPLHDEILAGAQARLAARECAGLSTDNGGLFGDGSITAPVRAVNIPGDVQWAADYYAASFMTRSGSAGTPSELTAGISIRWKCGGGGSSQRWRSAVESLPAWGDILRRWTFLTMDAFDLLADIGKVDAKAAEKGEMLRNGLYLDPPFPGPGDAYRNRFTFDDHRRMAAELRALKTTRVVLRYHAHPFINELYGGDPHWTITRPAGRLQTNEVANELLILNGESYTAAGSDGAA